MLLLLAYQIILQSTNFSLYQILFEFLAKREEFSLSATIEEKYPFSLGQQKIILHQFYKPCQGGIYFS